MPTACLENFQTLEQKLESLKWPKNPKVIFTSVGYHNDEIFKLYTANHAEKGATYIVGQHGANYFTNKNTVIEPGFDQSDKFFSWGNIKKRKVTITTSKITGIGLAGQVVEAGQI